MADNMEINETTAEVAEPIVKANGDVTSFDELEMLHSRDEPKAEKKEVKTKEQKDTKEEIKEEKDESETKDRESQKDSKEDSKENLKDQTKSKKVDKYKIKSGEKFYDVKPDATLDLTINGKREFVPVQKLIDTFNEHPKIKQEFEKVSQDYKSRQTQDQEIQKVLNHVHQLTQSGNMRGAIEYLADVQGLDGAKYWADMQEKLMQSANQYAGKSPEEIERIKMKEEYEYLKQRESTRRAREVEEKEKAEILSQIEQTEKEYGMTRDQFAAAYHEIAAMPGVDVNKLTPKQVAEYHKQVSTHVALEKNLSELGFEGDKLQYAQKELLKVSKLNPELSVEDLREIAVEVWGDKAIQRNLSRKVKRADPVNTAKPTKSRAYNPVSFDDIADL